MNLLPRDAGIRARAMEFGHEEIYGQADDEQTRYGRMLVLLLLLLLAR